MSLALFYLALVFYLLGTLHYLLFLLIRGLRTGRVASGATLIGFFFHTLSLLLRLYEAGHPPIGSLPEGLSFSAWAIVLFQLFLEHRHKSQILGAFLLPIALVLGSTGAALPKRIEALAPALKGFWLWVHISLSLFGYAAFALAFGTGLMYLLQERQLKRKHLGSFSLKLPSLELLDGLSYRSLSLGFPLLTLGIITGSIWAQYAWGSYWSWEPKQVWSLVTWFIYAALLHGRLSLAWRGRKAAILSIIGFGFVLFSFFGINLFSPGRHVF